MKPIYKTIAITSLAAAPMLANATGMGSAHLDEDARTTYVNHTSNLPPAAVRTPNVLYARTANGEVTNLTAMLHPPNKNGSIEDIMPVDENIGWRKVPDSERSKYEDMFAGEKPDQVTFDDAQILTWSKPGTQTVYPVKEWVGFLFGGENKYTFPVIRPTGEVNSKGEVDSESPTATVTASTTSTSGVR